MKLEKKIYIYLEKNDEFLIGYHSNFDFECNTERSSIKSLSIALGFYEKKNNNFKNAFSIELQTSYGHWTSLTNFVVKREMKRPRNGRGSSQ